MSNPLDSILGEIQRLSSHVTGLSSEVEQLRGDLDYMIESSVDTPSVWLTPKELAKLLGVSTSTIVAWRNSGIFDTKLSIKKVKRAKRVDHYYHRHNALKDAAVVRPAHQRICK